MSSLQRQMLSLYVLSIICVSMAYASTVHVSTTGSDRSPGTEAQPLRTIREAIRRVSAAKEPSEIVIHEGVYSGDARVGDNKDRLGGPRAHLLVTAARKPDGSFEEVVLDGARKIEEAEPVARKPGIFKVPGKFSYRYRTHMWEADTRTRYTLVADLAAVEQFPASFWHTKSEAFFRSSDGQPPEAHEIGMTRGRAGITLWRPNVTVRGLQCRNFLAWRWSAGVELRGANTAAEDCRVWNCVRGFQVMMEPENVRILRCRTDDCAGGVYSQGTRTVVEDCRLYKVRDGFMVPAYPQDDCGIQFYHPAFEGEVRRNLCVGFGSGIFVKCKTSEFVVEHNTCLDGIAHGIGCTSWHPKSVFRLNIVTGFSWPILSPGKINATNVVDYNCLWASRESSAMRRCMEDPPKVGTGTHTIFADPRFAAPVVQDYRLLPDSPCVKIPPEGKRCGAFGIVGADFKDVQPPAVRLSAAAPAKQAGGSGELYFERDPWIGGGRNLVRQLPPEGQGDQWVAPQAQITLEIEAQDYVSRPTQMVVRVGSQAWGEPEPFQARRAVELPPDAPMTGVSVRVSDEAGNWSDPTSILFRLAASGPKLRRPLALYANSNGVVISFETDTPCLATVEFGKGLTYGSELEQPKSVQRSWISGDGGDWVEIRSKPRVTNYLALLPPRVTSGERYHYRLVLEDEVGNRTVTDDGAFQLEGEPRSHFVSPSGEDGDGRGARDAPWRTIQFAVDRSLPGDRVALLPGLYPGEATLTHGGLDGAAITIEADEPGTAILDGRHEMKACLRLEHAPHVVIRGLEARWYKRAGIYIADSPQVSVLKCKIWNDFWMGWPIGSGVFAHRSPGLVADHNVIYQMEQGITLLQSPRSRVTHNTILKNMYGAVKFIYSAEGSVSRNNSFCYSGNDQYLVAYRDKKEFETFDSDYNNVGTKLRRPDPGDEIVPDSPFFRHHGSKAVISLNGKRFNSLRRWQKETGKDVHSIFRDPKYVDPENWDFRLKSDSPNIGVGEGGATIGALAR